jgi:hypothetical protein
MKNFSRFLSEAQNSLSVIQATRLGLVSDGHAGWYNRKTGEFVAKTEGGRLKFYNQNQVVGKKDPVQVRTKNNQKIVSTQNSTVRNEENIKDKTTDRNKEKELREKYIAGRIFKENTFVQNSKTGLVGKIVRRGTNHLICVTEDDVMFKSWIKDVVEWTDISGVSADKREVGTNPFREYVMKLTGTKDIKNFINKYKKRTK